MALFLLSILCDRKKDIPDFQLFGVRHAIPAGYFIRKGRETLCSYLHSSLTAVPMVLPVREKEVLAPVPVQERGVLVPVLAQEREVLAPVPVQEKEVLAPVPVQERGVWDLALVQEKEVLVPVLVQEREVLAPVPVQEKEVLAPAPVQEKEVWDLALEQGVLGAPAVRNHRSCTLCVCGKEIVTR